MQTSSAFSLKPLENTAEQRLSAARLICTNMGDYYRKYSMAWNQQIFDQNWPHRQNFGICHDNRPIGLLSLSLYNRHAYIRELQIMPGWQGRGAGSWALQAAEQLARQHKCECLRLKVFICNPALKLYDRAGFLIKMRDGDIFGMEKNIAAAPAPSQTATRYSLR